ncbi:hypothetical protein GA0070216_11533 [Micromonospora matsumotoense]|uniref:Uncharacterized protein n=1 Tax=Micromonospora matsumotoense TaxID=121616 RepID=A0A1C5AAD2_9ACTN|nr:DUF5995 family protein [Micromonospora matsumotoense]SCF42109.1 hypothetical protein GA0070216_11533 [Micromonospora matsumotoense]
MSEELVPVIATLRSIDPKADAIAIAEALWLCAQGHRTAEPVASSAADPAADSQYRQIDTDGDGSPVRPRSQPGRIGRPLYDMLPGSHSSGLGLRVGINAARPLPRALELARALRPFKTPWRAGRHGQLDIDATVRGYAETGQLVPAFRPAPERWFEAALVVDRSPGMAAWADIVLEFRRILAQLGAFRTIQTFYLDPSSDRQVLSDTAGLPTPPRRLRATDARQMIFVFTDCSAAGWQRREVWKTLRAWSESTPTALINPISAKLWDHAGLNLPATRVRAPAPGSRNQALSFRLPPMLRFGPAKDESWLPVPVLALTPHSLSRFAAALMRCDPAGCEAVLTTAKGRWTAEYSASHNGQADEPQARALVTSFRRLASPAANRLAVLAATCERLTLPMLRLIAETAVPEAGISDIGEVIAGGLLAVDAAQQPPFFFFQPGVRKQLQENLRVDDVWRLYELLSQHVGERSGAPNRFPVVFPESGGDVPLPLDAVPFAIASADALQVLGIPAQPVAGAEFSPRSGQAELLGSVRERLRGLVPNEANADLRQISRCRKILAQADLAAAEVAILLEAISVETATLEQFRNPDFVELIVEALFEGFWKALRQWVFEDSDLPLCWAALFQPPRVVTASAVRRAAVALNVVLNFELPRSTSVAAARHQHTLRNGGPEHLDHRRLVEVFSGALPGVDWNYLQRWQLLIATLNGDLDAWHGGELAAYTQDVVWRSIRQMAHSDVVRRQAELVSLDRTTAALGRLLGSSLGASLRFETDEALIVQDPLSDRAMARADEDPILSSPAWLAVDAVLRHEFDDVRTLVTILRRLQDHLEQASPLSQVNAISTFNELYLQIAENVLNGLHAGRFHSPAFISLLTIEQGRHYFDALRTWREDPDQCPRAWSALFAGVSQPRTAIRAEAAAGINALINFDLPFALVDTLMLLKSEPIDGTEQHSDYLQLNEIFARKIPALRRGYLERWQLMLDMLNGDLDDWYQGELVQYSRDVAWRNAQRLWGIRYDAIRLQRERDRLDQNSAALGKLLLSPLGAFLQ